VSLCYQLGLWVRVVRVQSMRDLWVQWGLSGRVRLWDQWDLWVRDFQWVRVIQWDP
jgi:hypothetical protein